VNIDRFAVQNFRSIQECDVELGPLTFFIGPNGSGKTSFVDALLFIGSVIRDSLKSAIDNRGGIHSILHHPISLPTSSQFDIYLSSPIGNSEFHLELGIVDGWGVSVIREECRIQNAQGDQHYYLVENGRVNGSAAIFPAVSVDRAFLSNASGLPEFRPLFDYLTGLGSTEPTPVAVHELLQRLRRVVRQVTPGGKDVGLAARFNKLKKLQPDRLEIIQQYLRAIAPPFDRLELIESNDTLWLQFVDRSSSGTLRPFYISQSSAGLVNSAEMLLELFEVPDEGHPPAAVIIEEPEALLHPGAIQVIRDSFIEASRFRQVLVTTHSPDLLDDADIPGEWIRIVHRNETGTHIDVLDAGTKSVIRDQLYTPGQLLRQGGLLLKA
jgi:predicted ATPase